MMKEDIISINHYIIRRKDTCNNYHHGSILVIMIILLVFYLRSSHRFLAKRRHLSLFLVVAGHIFSPTKRKEELVTIIL
jgi:hypothetical protein